MPIVTDQRILREIAGRVLNAPEATRPVIPERVPQGRGSGRADKASGRREPDGPDDPPPQQGEGPPGPEPPPLDAPLAAPPLSAAESAPSQTGGSERKHDARKGAGRAATAKRNQAGNSATGQSGRQAGNSADEQAALDRRLAFFPLTDLGNAERFRERQRGRLIWCAAVGWFWWDNRRWSRTGADAQVAIAAHLTIRSIQDEADAIRGTGHDSVIGSKGRGDDRADVMYSDQLRGWGRDSESNNKLNLLAKQAAAYLEVQPGQLDADPFCINVANGTLFIRKPDSDVTGPLPARLAANARHRGYVYFAPHDPADLITRIAPVDYAPDAQHPRFDAFLADVQPAPEMRRQLAAWRGYSLTADISEQKLSVFYGKGKNGKSVFEEICSYVAGDYSATTPVETFLDEGRGRNAGQATPELAELPGVRMLRTSEPNKGAKLNEGLIKLATGGEPLKVRHLNRDYFDFWPRFKLTISGNYRPHIGGTDEGIWRRVVLVPWSVRIPDDKQNPHLAQELRSEAPGILNWMLDGACDWLDNGLSLAIETQEATAEYRRDSDQLGRFLEACTEPALKEKVQSSVLHAVFNAWSVANAQPTWKGRGFSDAMTERGYRKDKSSVVFFLDIRLTKTEADFVDSEGRPRRAGSIKEGNDEPEWNDFSM